MRRVDIEPEVVGDVRSVDATWQTFRGPIDVHWLTDGSSFRVKVGVPPGVTASVHLPAASSGQVRESGVRADQAAGVRFVRQDGPRAVFDIGAGEYDFEVTGFRRMAANR